MGHSPYGLQGFIPEVYRQYYPNERVLRAWVPYEPNESPFIDEETYVRTKWNKSRAVIVRMIEDQLEATEEVFKVMSSTGNVAAVMTRLPTGTLARQKMFHAILALRLQGVEITEFQGKGEYARIEIFFEHPEQRVTM